MIDLRLLRDDPDRVRASQRARGEDESVVDAALLADETHRASLSEYERLRAEQKSIGRQVAAASGDERSALLGQVKQTAARVKDLDRQASAAEAERDRLVRTIGNVIVDGVPAGGEDDYTLMEQVGTPRDFIREGFEPRDHLDLASALGAVDMARGAKVSGARFYYLAGVGARLETALLLLALERAREAGFTQLKVPTLVTPEIMAGAGFLDAHADEVYRLEADDLYLTGTSEVALAGYHADEILDLTHGPRRYTALSTCFRREAGSHGKDTRGIIRVHEFQKVEMFAYCRLEDAEAEHERMLGLERSMLDSMQIPYRIIDTAAGDLGGPAARKYDCEAWIPTQGRYRELTSTSNCTTFQARRLHTRERDPGGTGTRTVATLNGTMATTRWLVAILENHQQADGSVVVPEALRDHVGESVLRPA
ncbi:MAG TPA: serine--tRNA ligase [Ornithinimicrobium sp.]|uniref:serine--tRNA ligase n=1 Tax=Ornithinimicrobium sp. TaxID=1977084 RepID=UPI002B4A6228|nr:serine--tRNA ligase [Ornithinimicrobium sp.]HKJ11468.1 serine--tRNA ligase [Ornithinimicrobium sp.]